MIDSIRNQCVAVYYKNFEEPNKPLFENLQQAIKEDVYLNKHYKSINFYLADNRYTLVPEQLFDKNKIKEYMKHIHNVSKEDEIHFTKIEKNDFYILYVYPSILTTFLVNHFPEIRLYHSNIHLIRNAFDHSKENNLEITGEILIHKNSFDIFILNNKNPVILNSFIYEKPEDIVYYTLLLINRTNAIPQSTKLILNGLIEPDSIAIKELRKRVGQVLLNTRFKTNFSFTNTQLHIWGNII